jgi:hypothetical protein
MLGAHALHLLLRLVPITLLDNGVHCVSEVTQHQVRVLYIYIVLSHDLRVVVFPHKSRLLNGS